MDSYDLLTSNCQTFCNKLLKVMRKSEFPTSTEILDREIDILGEALVGNPPKNVPSEVLVKNPVVKMPSVSTRKLSIAIEEPNSIAMSTKPTNVHLDLELAGNCSFTFDARR